VDCLFSSDAKTAFVLAEEELLDLFLSKASAHDLYQLFALKVKYFDSFAIDAAHSHQLAIGSHGQSLDWVLIIDY